VNDLKDRYRLGKVGDVEVKRKLARAINAFLDPIRERRAAYAQKPGMVEEVLMEGTRAMQAQARLTMEMVYDAMGMTGPRLRAALQSGAEFRLLA
jgi:tryptophanyl-tRNA synthetase